MKIYFDTCSLNRPMDDKMQLRVAVEAEAVLRVLALCETGKLVLLSSEVLALEVHRNPIPQCRAFVLSLLEKARSVIAVSDSVVQRAKRLERSGFKAFDALHLACAESANADYFCTCDDRLLKSSRRFAALSVKVVSPIELANQVSP